MNDISTVNSEENRLIGGYLQHRGLANFMLTQVILESNVLVTILLQEKRK